MKNRELEDIFKDLDFNVAEPSQGHEDRFLKRLKKENIQPGKIVPRIRMLWSPLLAVAAGLLLIVMLAGNSLGIHLGAESGDLAGVSPEMKETQQFYTNLINTELAKVQEASTPETKAIVEDALVQMEKLDKDYENLKVDLRKSGQDKRVIFAMISNLQQRIDVLTNVLNSIENIKELKNQNNENNII